jgi:hypothetical protein
MIQVVGHLMTISKTYLILLGLSRVRTSMSASTERLDLSDDPMTSALAAVRRLPQPADGGGRPPSDCRKGWPSASRRGRPPRPSDGGGGLPHLPKAVRNRRPFRAVCLRRLLFMTPISPFYTMCLLL